MLCVVRLWAFYALEKRKMGFARVDFEETRMRRLAIRSRRYMLRRRKRRRRRNSSWCRDYEPRYALCTSVSGATALMDALPGSCGGILTPTVNNMYGCDGGGFEQGIKCLNTGMYTGTNERTNESRFGVMIRWHKRAALCPTVDNGTLRNDRRPIERL